MIAAKNHEANTSQKTENTHFNLDTEFCKDHATVFGSEPKYHKKVKEAIEVKKKRPTSIGKIYYALFQ